MVTQKNHWVKEVIITIAKSSTHCSERPDFQPEQVERVLQIPSAREGKIWAICALVLPPGLLFSHCRAGAAPRRTTATSVSVEAAMQEVCIRISVLLWALGRDFLGPAVLPQAVGFEEGGGVSVTVFTELPAAYVLLQYEIIPKSWSNCESWLLIPATFPVVSGVL